MCWSDAKFVAYFRACSSLYFNYQFILLDFMDLFKQIQCLKKWINPVPDQWPNEVKSSFG